MWCVYRRVGGRGGADGHFHDSFEGGRGISCHSIMSAYPYGVAVFLMLCAGILFRGGAQETSHRPPEYGREPGGKKEAAPGFPANGKRVVGGYGPVEELRKEDRAVFEAAMKDAGGVTYKPLKVSRQVVAGTNYRFLCQGISSEPGQRRFWAVVRIFAPLPGRGAPSVTEIHQVPSPE